ncbi:MAG: hypothetical protein J7K26_03420 [Candidatus Aenigmarchaeota archaeon]|nr:hypothetical protein [Candidatus Aenigmarchaeota archaeon]
MFGLGKKKEEKEEIEQLKQQISRPVVPEIPKTMPEIEQIPVQLGAQPPAPLFVKVDDYKDILNRIISLKTFINNCKQLIEKDEQINATREKIRNKLKENLDNIETIALQLRKNFPLPEESKNIDHYQEPEALTGLESEIEKLKKQVEEIK